MKKRSKILCIVLSVVLVFGCFAAFAAASCDKKPVEVIFEYAANNTTKITVKPGDKIPTDSLPVDPKPASDKVFLYWSDNGTRDFVATESVSSNVTLKPVFRPRIAGEFIVWFDPAGSKYVPTQVVLMSQKATQPPAPSKTDATFEYWQSEEGAFDFNTEIKKDYYLTAIWESSSQKILVQSSGDFDKVFSPFFSTSANDSNVIGQTQITLISSDPNGQPYAGEDVPTVAKDYNYATYVSGELNSSDEAINKAISENQDAESFYTEYDFVIKNGIKFSDGQPLTVKDVIFNMYAYLDPVYSGSSTMYSTNIQGLQAYRMQDQSIGDVGSSDNESTYLLYAIERRMKLNGYFDISNNLNFTASRRDMPNTNWRDTDRNQEQVALEDAYLLRQLFWKELKSMALTAWSTEDVAKEYKDYGFKAGEYWKVFLLNTRMLTVQYNLDGTVKAWDGNDPRTNTAGFPVKGGDPWVEFNGTQIYEKWGSEDLVKIIFNSKMGILVNEELGNDDSNHKELGSPKVDLIFDESGNVIGSSFPIGDRSKDRDNLETFYGRIIDTTYSVPLCNNLAVISSGWAAGSDLLSYMIADEKSQFFLSNFEDELDVKTIKGITVHKVGPGQTEKEFTNINGVKKTYEEDHYVLRIRIRGVDPKAIWNFSFQVAPMHYYSNPEGKGTGFNVDTQGYKAFNYPGTEGYTTTKRINPGFAQFNLEYFNKVFRNGEVQGVPVGAGPFKATNEAGRNAAPGGVSAAEFCAAGQVNLRRNDYFGTTGAAMNRVKFEILRIKVIEPSKVIESLRGGDVHIGEPTAKQENVNELGRYSNIGYDLIENNGYGYIGINARYVPDIQIRQAIMTAFNTEYIRSYYTPALCKIITRPMSNHAASWAYPQDATDKYPFENTGSARTRIAALVNDAGFSDSIKYDNSWTKADPSGGTRRNLKFTFTVAGSSTDHPAYQMFIEAAKLLNECGFNITVKPDPYALSKLSAGTLAIWAAAWSSTIDPDMYQVYHPKSRATSTANWGYRYLLDEGKATTTESAILESLGDYIDEARQTLNTETRKDKYEEALDLVMQLAVEYPTYQRNNLIAYDVTKIDARTLVPQSLHSPYYGPFSAIWKIELLK